MTLGDRDRVEQMFAEDVRQMLREHAEVIAALKPGEERKSEVMVDAIDMAAAGIQPDSLMPIAREMARGPALASVVWRRAETSLRLAFVFHWVGK